MSFSSHVTCTNSRASACHWLQDLENGLSHTIGDIHQQRPVLEREEQGGSKGLVKTHPEEEGTQNAI